MHKVEFMGQTTMAPDGANLRMVLVRARMPLYASAAKALNCRGRSTCGTCAVRVEGPVSEPTETERRRLSRPPHDPASGLRLACQVRVLGDLVVMKQPGLFGSKTPPDESEI